MDYRLYNQEQDFSWSQPKQFNYENDGEFSELDSQLVDKLSLETDWIFSFNNTTPQLPQINNPNLNAYPITSTSTSSSKLDSHLQNVFNSKPNTFSTSFNSQFKQQPNFPPLNYSDSIPSYNPLQSAPVPSTITIWFAGLPQNITSELFTKALQKHDCHPIALSTVIDRSHCAFASFIDPNVLTRLNTFEIGGRRIRFRIKHATGQIASLLNDAGLFPHHVTNFSKSSIPLAQGSGLNLNQGHLSQTSQVPFTPKLHPQDRPKRPTLSSNPSFFYPKQATPQPQSQSQSHSHSQLNQPSTSSSMQHENNAVAAAAAAASLTALSVLKTPHVMQAASAPNGPGQDVLEQTQHYLSLLVEGFRTQSSKIINEGSGQMFSQAEKIADKLQQPTVSNDKIELSQPQVEGEPSVIYTWKGDGRPRRFFILKALSKSDLDTSREENKWSTQAQNEEILNKAFNEASHVILFMSANKQRGFYGLARMTSKIPNEEYADEEQNVPPSDIPTQHSSQDTDNKSKECEDIRTNSIKGGKSNDEKTWSAPSAEYNDDLSLNVQEGRQNKSDPIIPMKVSQTPKGDDKQRTKKEEIEDTRNAPGAHLISPTVTPSQFQTLDAPSPMEKLPPIEDQNKQTETENHTQRTRTFGRPFSVEWLSTQPVPFSKLKGVNNPWNMNRPVKVSRDGTEVETRVGEQLVEEFGISASKLDLLTNHDR